MFHVYILYSAKLERYYIGSTELLPEARLEQHNSLDLATKFTRRGQPWQLKVAINCQSRLQALRIERHVKRMKSRKYLEDLLRYPEMREKLIKRYEVQDS
ncbi:GIY-YIG nuclease family protein [Neolewinella aquimaris]|uniref:GIY-YIG nuclease family protein n=1 Tax=Neolewinella aquimaris TaxID=1835722 RepID=UPI001612A084